MITRAFEIRLYPTKDQEVKLNRTFGACRFLYNNVLFIQTEYYKEYKESANQKEIVKKLKKENEWLKDIGAQALCQSLNDLNRAYKNWWNSLKGKTKQKAKAPTFHKKNGKQSYRDCMPIKDFFKLIDLENRKISIPKIGKVTFRQGYDFSKYGITKVHNITVKKSKSGKYFCSICVDCDDIQSLPQNNYNYAFDLGIKDFLIDSDGCVVENPKYFRTSQEKLAKEQRKLSKMTKGSNNRKKQVIKVARIYEKISNQRKDFQHKQSRRIVNENQVIISEDLKPSNMLKNHKLAKSIADASFSSFCNMIAYKSAWYGRQYIKIGSFYPSSKLCHCCGYKNTTLTLADREWECPNCHTLLDRDKNAALNILNEGLRILGQELSVERVDTDDNSHLEREDSTLKGGVSSLIF